MRKPGGTMDNRQIRTMQSFEHALLYLEMHPVTPEPPLLARMRASLQDVVKRLQSLGAGRVSSASAGAGERRRRRASLRREMMALRRIAKPLLKFAPGAEQALRVPHARANAATLVAAVVHMATLLEPHVKLLEEAGYTRSFLKEFRAEAELLAESSRADDRARSESGRARLDVAAALKEGMRTVTVIEGILMRHFAGNRHRLALWKSRRRVPKRIGRPKRRKLR